VNQHRFSRHGRHGIGLASLCLVACALIVSACSGDADDAPAGSPQASAGGPSEFVLVADVQSVMYSILEPAAEVYWDAVGWIIDYDGIHDIRPESDEAWEEVRNAAFVIAESGNLLLMEGRGPNSAAWIGMSHAMIDMAQRAIVAAEARDEALVFDVGGDLYQTCVGCHSIYALETLRPSSQMD